MPVFRAELLRFSAGAHDDQIDALGLVRQLLDRMLLGQHRRRPRRQRWSPLAIVGLKISADGA
jgi:hypothetical protein